MGSVGDCHGNAAIEAFWSRMEVEPFDTRRWTMRVELAVIFQYIEILHNNRRCHSAHPDPGGLERPGVGDPRYACPCTEPQRLAPRSTYGPQLSVHQRSVLSQGGRSTVAPVRVLLATSLENRDEDADRGAD
jgi:hypothetical protein